MDDKTKKSNNSFDISVNLDTTPIIYTDNIHMTTNPYGVVLDITQRLASTNQLRVVSRVGMSREHAKKFLEEFGKLLAITEGSKQTGKKN